MHYCKNQKPSSQALAFNESATYVRIKSFIKKIISKLNKKTRLPVTNWFQDCLTDNRLNFNQGR
ncbi:MAG: hypothetical protein CVT94_03065 [Bacteroidetes bacterium HGW-Bacteroidetes-11]|nr:MAG: hypothetical protein CVT94_03065 [Bacteroidetes bacterium HGW-Bacteroidetes-11]